MAKVAMPSMRRYRYNENLAAGTIAAGGTMGILIPPSIALAIYGIIVEEDVGKLFIAGIVPGIITILLYILVIKVLITFRPSLGPRGPWTPWKDRFLALKGVWGMIVLFLLVLGGIYLGVFTPTEAGGLGAVGAVAFAVSRRKMGWRGFCSALIEAGQTTAMVFSVAFGAIILSNFMNISGMPNQIVDWVNPLEIAPITVVLVICLIYIALGCVFEGIGMNVFVLKTIMPEMSLWGIFAGISPFFIADIVRLALIVFIPGLTLDLPSLMGG